MLNLSKEKILEIIACVAVFCGFMMLIKLGLDMHLVTEWRMNGERAKANAFLLNRGALIFFLVAISTTAFHILDKITARNKVYQDA